MTPIQLRDKDGGLLASIDKLGDAGHGTDAHVVNYNNGRYLMFTSGRQQSSGLSRHCMFTTFRKDSVQYLLSTPTMKNVQIQDTPIN